MIVSSQIPVDYGLAGIVSHTCGAEDGSRTRHHWKGFDLGRLKRSKDSFVPTHRKGKASFGIVVNPIMYAWPRNTDGVGPCLVRHDPVGRVGKRLGRGAQREL